MTTIFSCPVCKKELFIEGRTYKCENRHSFDISKEGYVNLLLSGKSTDTSGDDKEMVSARTHFLDSGYYEPLRKKVSGLIQSLCSESSVLLDAGCGEGYYTSAYAEISEASYGIDISKAAVKHASNRCKKARFALGSVYHLPILDQSCDVIVNCFSPNAPEEFRRVLKKGGHLLYVVPGARHLWELKSILYDNPYENAEKTEDYDGFELSRIVSAVGNFTLGTNRDILSLFHMTPYTWNTPKECAERLVGLESLDMTYDFKIHVYKKLS